MPMITKIGKASPKTSTSDLGSDLAEAYTSRMAERTARDAKLSDEQRVVLKLEEKTRDTGEGS
jgi:hypothetical protein